MHLHQVLNINGTPKKTQVDSSMITQIRSLNSPTGGACIGDRVPGQIQIMIHTIIPPPDLTYAPHGARLLLIPRDFPMSGWRFHEPKGCEQTS